MGKAGVGASMEGVKAADPSRNLYNASKNGLEDMLCELLAEGADPNSVFGMGESAAMLAVGGGHAKALSILLEAGADPGRADYQGDTPVMRACRLGRDECLRVLMSAGADPGAAHPTQGSPALTAIMNGNVECLGILCENGFSPSYREDSQRKRGLLDFAASQGSLECVELLISKGARIDDAGPDGQSAAFKAAARGHFECLAALLRAGADPSQQDSNGISLARACGSPLCRQLVEARLELSALSEAALSQVEPPSVKPKTL